LLDLDTLEKYDPQGMHKIYDKWPEIAEKSFQLDLQPIDFSNVNHIVFAGMGGSGAIGDIFSSILSKTKIHVSVVKGYTLPKTVDSDTLVVTTSISGNTEETLTILGSAKKISSKIIAFSNGGKMEKYCKENSLEYRHIPMLHSPRASFTSFLYSMLKVLAPILPIRKEDVVESIVHLKDMRKEISSTNLTENNPSLALAKWINDIPLIYYPFGLQAAAIRFKNSLQENSKMHAITEDVIEACHDGIVAWEKNAEVQPILIVGEDDYIKTKERWEILKEYFEEKKIDFKEINSVSGNILTKLVNLIYLLDYASIYRALIVKIDPTPIKSIDFVKKRLI